MSVFLQCRRTAQCLACLFLAMIVHDSLFVHDARGQDAGPHLGSAKAEMSKFLGLPSEEAAREKSKSYIPTREDCAQVFTPDTAESVFNYFQKAAADGEFVIGAPPAYTEVKLTAVTTDEIGSWSGTAAKEMAGGWKRIRNSVLPGHTMYIVRFVKPGKDSGMRYDGLIKLNDKWVMFPKAWRHAQAARREDHVHRIRIHPLNQQSRRIKVLGDCRRSRRRSRWDGEWRLLPRFTPMVTMASSSTRNFGKQKC